MKTPQEIADIRAILAAYKINPATAGKIAECETMTIELCKKVCRSFDLRSASSADWIPVACLVDDLREAIERMRRASALQAQEATEKASVMVPKPGRYAASFGGKVAYLRGLGIHESVAAELSNHVCDTHTEKMLIQEIDILANKSPGIVVNYIRAIKPPKSHFVGQYIQGAK